MLPLNEEQKFEALKIRYEDQVALLRFMTKLDFEIFGAYAALQLALGSWLTQHIIPNGAARFGVLLIDLALAIIAGVSLYYDYRRRREVTGTIRNINSALGFDAPGFYIDGKNLNASTTFRPWAHFYIVGVIACYCGIVMVIFRGV